MIKAFIKRMTTAWVTSAIVFSFAVFPASAATYGENLLANSGFESGMDSWIKSGSCSMEATTADQHSGESSLLISGRTATNESPKQAVNLKANTEYYVSVWIKPVSDSEKARGKLRFTGDGSLGLAMKDFPAGSWTQFTATFNSDNLTDLNDVDVYIGTSNTTGGNAAFYLDDFELREVITENPEIVVEGNMISNAGLELGTISGFNVSDCSGSIADTNVHTGSYAALSTNRKANYGGIQTTDIAIEPDTYYYLGIYAMAGAETSVSARVRLQKTEGNTAVTNTASNKPLSNTEYELFDGVLYNKDATKGKIFVQTNESGLSAENYGVDIYTDDYVLLPITSSVENGATGVERNSDITLIVPEAITVSTDTLSINNGATITNVARTGRECVVSFGGMDYGTEYTLTLTTGKGDSPSYTFTTAQNQASDPNLLADYDPGFESGEIKRGWDQNGTMSVVSTKSYKGTNSVFVSEREYNYSGPQLTISNLEENTDYFASAWVYTDAEGEKAKIRLQATGISVPDPMDLTQSDWTYVWGVLNTGSNTSAKFYVQTNGTSDIYIDDCVVQKVGVSEASVSSALSGATDVPVDSLITITFSDEVFKLENKNVLLNGTAVSGAITTSDNTSFTINPGALENGAEYTVKVTGVLDAELNKIADATFTFTTVEAQEPEPEPGPGPEPEVPEIGNLIESNNPGFESGSLNSPWAASGTVTVTNAQAHSGSYSALASERAANDHGPKITVSVEANKDYYISAWIKPKTGSGRGTVRMWANGGSTIAQPSMVDFAENVWTHTRAIVNSGTNTSVKIGINTNNTTGGNTDLYMDDFEIIPYTPTTIVSQTPSRAEGVSIKEILSFTFNNEIEKVTKDNFTVSDRKVESVSLSDDKKTVTLSLNKDFDANTEYTVTSTGITDKFGVIAETQSFTFKTGESVAVTEAPGFYRGDSPLTVLTPGEITVKAKFRNDGTVVCQRPIMMAVMYGADGRMRGIKSTPLTGNLGAGEETGDVPLALTVTTDVKSIAIYVFKSYSDITYLTSPVKLAVAE